MCSFCTLLKHLHGNNSSVNTPEQMAVYYTGGSSWAARLGMQLGHLAQTASPKSSALFSPPTHARAHTHTLSTVMSLHFPKH